MIQRNTKQKEAILSVMQGAGIHRTADEVLSAVHELIPGIGQATVYRNLNRLCSEGKIRKITGDGWNIYDGNPMPHDHLHCAYCGKLYDISSWEDSAMDRHAEEEVQGIVLRHSVLYEGICADCLERQNEGV